MSTRAYSLGLVAFIVPLGILCVFQPGYLHQGVATLYGAFLRGDYEVRSGPHVVAQVKGVSKGGALSLCEKSVEPGEFTPANLECYWAGEKLRPEPTRTERYDEGY